VDVCSPSARLTHVRWCQTIVSACHSSNEPPCVCTFACVRNAVCWLAEVCRDHVHTHKQMEANIQHHLLRESVECIQATFRHALYILPKRIETVLLFAHRNAGYCIVPNVIRGNSNIPSSRTKFRNVDSVHAWCYIE
jgi:hypothetical protein